MNSTQVRLAAAACAALCLGCTRDNPLFDQALPASEASAESEETLSDSGPATTSTASTTAVTTGAATTAMPLDLGSVTTTTSGAPSCDDVVDHETTLVYINTLEPVDLLEGGADDACRNVISPRPNSPGLAKRWTPLGVELDPQNKELLAEAFSEFNIEFVYERPEYPPYQMVLALADLRPTQYVTNAFAPDCGNANPNSVEFAFLDAMVFQEDYALHLSRAVAWSLGLEVTGSDVFAPHEITGSQITGMPFAFLDDCRPVTSVNPQCGAQHEQFCAEGEQNSAQEIADVLGPGD